MLGLKGDIIVELQIQDLVEALKKDGVEAAQNEADKIILEAKAKAEKIIADAKAEADTIIKKANDKVEILKDSARTSAEHAKRDALLFFKNSVKAEFENLLNANIDKCVDTKTLANLILAALNDDEPSKYTAEVNEVTEGLKSELAKELKAGLEIKANPNVRIGFRLTQKDGAGYFDCSDEELKKIMAPFFPEIII